MTARQCALCVLFSWSSSCTAPCNVIQTQLLASAGSTRRRRGSFHWPQPIRSSFLHCISCGSSRNFGKLWDVVSVFITIPWCIKSCFTALFVHTHKQLFWLPCLIQRPDISDVRRISTPIGRRGTNTWCHSVWLSSCLRCCYTLPRMSSHYLPIRKAVGWVTRDTLWWKSSIPVWSGIWLNIKLVWKFLHWPNPIMFVCDVKWAT